MNDVRVRLHKDDTDVNRLMAFAVTQLSGKKKKKNKMRRTISPMTNSGNEKIWINGKHTQNDSVSLCFY